MDNAGNNHTSMQEYSCLLEKHGIEFDPVEHQIPCFPHIINICVKHIVDKYSIADFSGVPETWVVSGETINKAAYVQAIAGKALDRARVLVCTVHASIQHHDSFMITITMGNNNKWFLDHTGSPTWLPVVQLLHDEPTHWDSVYVMLNCLRTLCQVSLHPTNIYHRLTVA